MRRLMRLLLFRLLHVTDRTRIVRFGCYVDNGRGIRSRSPGARCVICVPFGPAVMRRRACRPEISGRPPRVRGHRRHRRRCALAASALPLRRRHPAGRAPRDRPGVSHRIDRVLLAGDAAHIPRRPAGKGSTPAAATPGRWPPHSWSTGLALPEADGAEATHKATRSAASDLVYLTGMMAMCSRCRVPRGQRGAGGPGRRLHCPVTQEAVIPASHAASIISVAGRGFVANWTSLGTPAVLRRPKSLDQECSGGRALGRAAPVPGWSSGRETCRPGRYRCVPRCRCTAAAPLPRTGLSSQSRSRRQRERGVVSPEVVGDVRAQVVADRISVPADVAQQATATGAG